ncbi:MAG: phosphoenolpyruvate carboxykinase (ATP) [Flavobacteriaceae bacterium]|nr:phosphoenolpyruvate carboxykinase (ATP) [Flavobacteriaceae bacterium]
MSKEVLSSENKTLKEIGINSDQVNWNLSPQVLHQICLDKGLAKEASSGALAINTGEFTGRSPKDRFIVKDDLTKDTVWWGPINKPFDKDKFDDLYTKVANNLSTKEIYVRDVAACADPRYRMNIRVISELPWVSLFVNNMFLRLSEKELENFDAEWTILHSPSYMAIADQDGTRQHNFAVLSFSRKTILIGGTGYTGEVKKGIFSALNFVLPTQKDTLPMHCSANVGEDGETAIFFGLSGTGKTTLSADPKRKLIGDDEHGWTKDNTIFNFEGGCYAKAIDLSADKEPEIFNAIKKGALLENIVMKEGTNEVDFEDVSITQNTRVSYPIDHIENIQVPSVAGTPKNIFFLTADAFGVLPPISKLTPGQAAYHFISGYTAKVAGTEAGVNEPEPSFSACFGAPFMPLHPTKYAEMLSKKMQDANVTVWLVNTGWTGGAYGTGSRMKLKYTRAMITSAMNGKLKDVEFAEHPVFKLAVPTTCENVPSEVLRPRETWADKAQYDIKAKELAQAFHDNFKKFEEYANDVIMGGAPA